MGDQIFEILNRYYEKSLDWSLRHTRFMLVLVLAAITTSIGLLIVVPKGFFPEQDTGRLMGNIQADQDISFQSMRQKMIVIADIISSDPDVESVSAFTGSSTDTNKARMFISLKDFDKRKSTATEVITRLRKKLAHVPGAPTYIQSAQELRIGGRMGAGLYQYTLQSENLAELNAWATQMTREMRTLPQLVDVNSDLQNKGLQSTVVIDRHTASRMGITAQMIDDALYDAYGQRQVSVIYTTQNQYRVVMEVEPRFWQRPESLRNVHIIRPSGVVPLSTFAHFEPTATSLSVNHQGQFPSVTISFGLARGVALGEAVAAIQDAKSRMGFPESINDSFQGTARAFQASLANQPWLILAALVSVYIVLGILYESYIHPHTILSTLPSAGVGAVLALMACRIDLSVIALVGIILLIGLVKKNGIMIVDFALEAERKGGKGPFDAIRQASLLRFRPIMMTTMAALLGALPLALGMGVGSELRRPLGITIIGGLILSQVLTLYTTPVMYLYLDRFRLWLNNRRNRKMKYRPAPALLVIVAGMLLLLNACSVGPNYVKPKTEPPVAFKEMAGWKMAQPKDDTLHAAWWKLFQDPELNTLQEEVIVSNQNLAAAEAQFRQALALAQVSRASYFPVITTTPTYTRSLASSSTSSAANIFRTLPSSSGMPTNNDFLLPLSLSWELDVWGRVRRLNEASQANVQASASDLAATRLSLQAQLAQNYFQIRALDAQKQILDATIAAYQKTLEMTKNRFASGIVSKADVLQAETQLKTTLAQVVDLGVQRAQLEHAAALLCGKPASGFSIPLKPLSIVPPMIPVSLPSELLERRPDIASAERRVAAANAQVGVAIAGYFPTITLGASMGYEANDLSKLLDWPSRFWSVGPSMAQTIFQGGAKRAQTAQARAAFDAAAATYRQTVLTAFQEVEDNLATLRILEQEIQVQAEALKAARQSLDIAINQYKAGIVSYLNVTAAQTAALSSERQVLDIQNRRMVASVLLIKALGGGWDGKTTLNPVGTGAKQEDQKDIK